MSPPPQAEQRSRRVQPITATSGPYRSLFRSAIGSQRLDDGLHDRRRHAVAKDLGPLTQKTLGPDCDDPASTDGFPRIAGSRMQPSDKPGVCSTALAPEPGLAGTQDLVRGTESGDTAYRAKLSPRPQRGPEASQRMSLAIFISATASPHTAATAATIASSEPCADWGTAPSCGRCPRQDRPGCG
jgi:hypothetical protein